MFLILPSFFLQIYLLLAIALTFYYAALMWRYLRNWKALPAWEIPEDFVALSKVSVLVPARNEAANIEACIQSILQQNYPSSLYEIIVIDDHSTDATPDLVMALQKKNPQIKLIRLSDFQSENENFAFKKWAIEKGVEQAAGDLILTTDADCLAPPDWLTLVVSFYQTKNLAFIAAPVNFHREKNALEYFQSLDFIGMMGITGAGIHGRFQHMCNGANLAYEKEAFFAVNGFSGIDGKASGDDMLLLQKMVQYFPERVGFLKNRKATVLTQAMPDWKSFLQQRIRWASKSYDYPEWRVTLRLALVFAFCLTIFLSFFLIPFLGKIALLVFLGMLVVKLLVDYFFLRRMSQYFGRTDLLKKYFSSAFFHLIYIVQVGIWANIFKSYTWKGRKVR